MENVINVPKILLVADHKESGKKLWQVSEKGVSYFIYAKTFEEAEKRAMEAQKKLWEDNR